MARTLGKLDDPRIIKIRTNNISSCIHYSACVATRLCVTQHTFDGVFTDVTLWTRSVVRARDFSEQPSHTRRTRINGKWRTATAQRTHGTSRLRVDELTPSFSTDIITYTRTVLTTDDPPLVTFLRRTVFVSLSFLVPFSTIYFFAARFSALTRKRRNSWPLFLSHSLTRWSKI